MRSLMRVLLLCSLLPAGVRCDEDAVFVYSSLGGAVVLPCPGLASSNCSLLSWTFWSPGKGDQVRYTEEVSGGRVNSDSDKSDRVSVTPDCSLRLRGLRVEDAGSYVCRWDKATVSNAYLSLLGITSLSGVGELRAGGNLSLRCVLFTYYDAGSCKTYSRSFSLSWVTQDGAPLPRDGRYELVDHTRCSLTLTTRLRGEDGGRRWRCQVNTTGNSRAAFQDFRSVFLFQSPSTGTTRSPARGLAEDCGARLPVSRIVLCVALPVMVLVVGLFTWRRHREDKMAASAIELQDMS